MNKYFVVFNNDTKVITDKGIITEDITNNIGDILIKENELEEMEKKLKDILENKKESERNIVFYKDLWVKIYLMAIGMFVTSAGIIQLFNGAFNLSIFLFSVLAGIFSGFIFNLGPHEDYKVCLKEKKVLDLQEYYLEQEIPKKGVELELLREKSKLLENKEENAKIEKIEDREVLLRLKNNLESLKEIGLKTDKYAKKYANGLWNERDKQAIEKTGIDTEMIENYLESYNILKLEKGKKI